MAIREANEAQIAEGADDNRFPVYPQRMVADIRRVLPSEGIVALDNGIYKIWFARNYKAHKPNTVCWTTPWRPWAPACHRPWPRTWCTRTAR